jgi:hypothetical protein
MLLAIYILINFVFAGLYLLGGNCIAELPSGSFNDAFFFSVETLNTVGYGHMYPDTFYGHFVRYCRGRDRDGRSGRYHRFDLYSILETDRQDSIRQVCRHYPRRSSARPITPTTIFSGTAVVWKSTPRPLTVV